MLERICGHNKSETVPFMILECENCRIETNANKYARRGILLMRVKVCERVRRESRVGKVGREVAQITLQSLRVKLTLLLLK